MYAVRKADQSAFTPTSKDICRIENGSTNAYLKDARAIEEFLKGVEPNYNASVEKLRNGTVDRDCISTIAGFVSYVMCCSPAAMRLGSTNLQCLLDTFARVMDAQDVIPLAPSELDGKRLTELLDDGALKFEVDPKFPQAVGIEDIQGYASAFGNCRWDVLINTHADSPFFSSDYPAAIETSGHPWVLNKIVPLAPDLAIRIRPDINQDLSREDLTFSNFESRAIQLSRKHVIDINRLIVRCAESLVFYRNQHPWVSDFIRKNSGFRIEFRPMRVSTPDGFTVFPNQQIVSTR